MKSFILNIFRRICGAAHLKNKIDAIENLLHKFDNEFLNSVKESLVDLNKKIEEAKIEIQEIKNDQKYISQKLDTIFYNIFNWALMRQMHTSG